MQSILEEIIYRYIRYRFVHASKPGWLYIMTAYVWVHCYYNITLYYQGRIKEERACNSTLSVHVASRVQTWAEECVHLHKVLKIEISIFSISCAVMHIHPPTFELCSYRSCMPSLLLYALDTTIPLIIITISDIFRAKQNMARGLHSTVQRS